MANENKTRLNDGDVISYLNTVEKEQKREDCFKLLTMMEEITGQPPQLWGDSIVGYGAYHYVTMSGREGDWFLTGFAPRARNITVYIMAGFEQYDELMEKLGKFKIGKSCLYISKLADVDENVLRTLIKASAEHVANSYDTVLST